MPSFFSSSGFPCLQGFSLSFSFPTYGVVEGGTRRNSRPDADAASIPERRFPVSLSLILLPFYSFSLFSLLFEVLVDWLLTSFPSLFYLPLFHFAYALAFYGF
uniref:Uncharacterized protein n=1 Tax=Trypanosoma congolense (strain IL3000) TaxID=1068625 RepID=G0URY8_TRYCI|nr:hypothetical protein, unlikely [Trypanosoma congolense IL3000]